MPEGIESKPRPDWMTKYNPPNIPYSRRDEMWWDAIHYFVDQIVDANADGSIHDDDKFNQMYYDLWHVVSNRPPGDYTGYDSGK